MDKINDIKDNNRQICENILQKKDNFMKEELCFVENIIKKDNTDPIIILTYLKLLRKFKKEELLENIKKYEFFLPKETINKEFSETYIKMSSSSELFYMLYSKISSFSYTIGLVEKNIIFSVIISNLLNHDSNYIRGFTDYASNKELSIFILVRNIKKGIIKRLNKINVYKVDEKNPMINLLQNMITEAKIVKKVYDFDNKISNIKPSDKEREIYFKRKSCIKGNINKTIKMLEESIILRSKFDDEDFISYFQKLSNFLMQVKENFDIRFNCIDNLSVNDFNLLMDFCLFIQHCNFNDSCLYLYRWIDTFKQTIEIINDILKKNSIPNFKEYELKDNTLILRLFNVLSKEKLVIEIKNINKYSIHSIIKYLSDEYVENIFHKPEKESENIIYNEKIIIINDYRIEKYLKFDSLQDIYINKIWNIFKDHLIRIFISPVMKSALKLICKKLSVLDYYDFLNEHDLTILFNRSHIFQFKSDFVGLTDPSFFVDFIYYRGFINSYNNDCSKLLNLCTYQVTKEHEMLGHLNVRMQNYFSNKEISSPIPKNDDKSKNTSGQQESGIILEMILYDQCINKLNINEILFLLDEENYNVELDIFKNNFKKSKEGPYQMSNSLKNLLKLLNITISSNFEEYGDMTIYKDLSKQGSSEDEEFNLNIKSHYELLHFPPPQDYYVVKYLNEIYEKYLESNGKNENK